MIRKYLIENGWDIEREELGKVFASRNLTGKKAVFIKIQDECTSVGANLVSVWTKKKIHPFGYFEKDGKLAFFDFLFGEQVNNP